MQHLCVHVLKGFRVKAGPYARLTAESNLKGTHNMGPLKPDLPNCRINFSVKSLF